VDVASELVGLCRGCRAVGRSKNTRGSSNVVGIIYLLLDSVSGMGGGVAPGSDGSGLALAFEWRAEQISRHQQFLSTTAAIIYSAYNAHPCTSLSSIQQKKEGENSYCWTSKVSTDL